MKRLSALLLALMMLLSLAACGGEAAPAITNSEAVPSLDEAQDALDEAQDALDEIFSQVEEAISTDAEPSTDIGEISFTEVVAVDNEECVIKITGIDPNHMFGYAIKAFFENKSADKTYMFSVAGAAVNGVQCDPFFASEVAAGKKANKEVYLPTDDLEEIGVGAYTDIELTFRVYDSNDWSADPVAIETIHIYPYGEDKATAFVREAQPSDNVIIDNEYVTVIVTGYEVDDIWGYTANLFLMNKTDVEVMFTVDEVSVNGFMADPYYADSVIAGKCAFSSMSWSDSTLEENGITSIEEIEFNLRAYDYDDWYSTFADETIILNP